MPNSQEQSLDENVIFQQVNITSAEFLYSEKERQAVERLLSAGPEAFYNTVGNESSGCFLSSEEVSQINHWAQDFHSSHLQVPKEENGEEEGLQIHDFSSTYFPSHSDAPAPSLELGWPEKVPWMRTESIKVYTSPPAEGDPSVREVIRRQLQKASQVIAIVTDRLTDGTIIGDLHSAAFRDVPVYIILNQRSIKDNITLNRLRHPNIQVRVLGGKTFCSRTGRMVEGELKEKFLLVDVKTVIHGSYSLTWTDAHLHRQLITVLSGSVVDTFDKEFRILFAASQPVPDMWRVASTLGDEIFPLRDVSYSTPPCKIAQKHEVINPPSPPHDALLDWEAMGVVRRQSFHGSPFGGDEGTVRKKVPQQNDMLVERKKQDVFTHNGQETPVDMWRRTYENTSPVRHNMPNKSRVSDITQPASPASPTSPASPAYLTSTRQRVESKMQQTTFRQLSDERSNTSDDKQTKYRFDDKRREPVQSTTLLSPTKQRERSRLEPVLLEETSVDGSEPKLENTPTSRKPLILRVPQSESFSSLSDIMKRLQPQQSSAGNLRKGLKFSKSEMSQSMMDLSVPTTDINADKKSVPVPRLNATYMDSELMTPAFLLMKKRNNEVKSALNRMPKTFLPRDRPRSSSYANDLNWRSLGERKEEQK